jgi:hypothetical protein
MELKSTTINLVETRDFFTKFLQKEKNDGVKKAWYYYHQTEDEVMALDDRSQFLEMVELYKSQNVIHTKTLVKDGVLGAKKANMLVFRCKDETKHYPLDPLSLSFDYYPADCEMVIMEIIHTLPPKTQTKKKKRK